MFCCHKTGVKITRCKEVVTTNTTSPKAVGIAEHETIYTGLLALVAQNSRHEDNFDESGQIVYRSYIAMLDETIYQAKKWQIMDILEYNDGFLMSNTNFDNTKEKRSGKIYSVREVAGSLKTGKKYREIKIRFDYQ